MRLDGCWGVDVVRVPAMADGDDRNTDDLVHFGLRAHILQKMFVCLETTLLDDLTVSAVCRKAGISRTTFYRLFSGKYDVYNWHLRVTMRSNFAQVGDVFSWDQALLRFFRSMDANRKLSQMFFASGSPGSPREMCLEYVQRALRRSVGMRFRESDSIPHRYEFEILAFSRAFTLALVDWLESDAPAYSAVDDMLTIIPRELYDMLNVDAQGLPFTNESVRKGDDAVTIELVAESVFTSF